MQKLHFILARQIKAAIWAGAKHTEIAVHFDVSSATISRMQNGLAWQEVPWPDGSTGALSPHQRAVILDVRYRGTRVPYTPNSSISGHIPTPGVHILDPNEVQAQWERIQEEEDLAAMKKFLEPAGPEERGNAVEYAAPIPMLDLEAWADLLERHSDNAFVQAAKAGTTNAKIALTETFRLLPEEEWESDKVAVYIKAALRELERSNPEQDH